MRIEIKTDGQVKDTDVRALFLINEALYKIGTERMRFSNLWFFADQMGYQLVPKNARNYWLA